jgi:hypothetical protein
MRKPVRKSIEKRNIPVIQYCQVYQDIKKKDGWKNPSALFGFPFTYNDDDKNTINNAHHHIHSIGPW